MQIKTVIKASVTRKISIQNIKAPHSFEDNAKHDISLFIVVDL